MRLPMTQLGSIRYADYNKAASPGKGICIECGACVEKCPLNIPIIDQLKETEAALGGKHAWPAKEHKALGRASRAVQPAGFARLIANDTMR